MGRGQERSIMFSNFFHNIKVKEYKNLVLTKVATPKSFIYLIEYKNVL